MNNSFFNDEKQADDMASAQEIHIEPEVEIRCMTDIEMKPVSWLWDSRIARGKLTVLAGNPGLGKSQTVASIAAIVSNGGHWPEMVPPSPRGDVLLISAEDDPADTIKPRLMAAGADMARCHVLEAIRIFSAKTTTPTERSLDLREDVQRLEMALSQLDNPVLVVIDPVSAYLGNTDSHNNADMRGLLAPLSKMAEKTGVAMILITHLNKSQQQDAIARVMGSVGLIAAARAGYIVQKDGQQPEKRYFLPIKNNIGNDSTGFAYHIEGVTLDCGIQTSRVVWASEPVKAHEILHAQAETKPTATNGAQAFLEELLSQGAMSAKEVFDEAEGMGYSKQTMQRSATKLGIKRKKQGMEGGWLWSLPDCELSLFSNSEDTEDVEDTPLT